MSWVKSLLQRPAVSNSTPPLVDNATSEELMKPVRNLFRNLVLCTTSQEREVVFVKLLPAFETCFAKCPPERITERFGEIYTLAHQAAKHLDLEVKRLGQGKPKADAAEAIFSFFESPSCSVILSGLILFSRCHDDVVEEVCRSNIPSTLCKCIFLFADLLPSKSTDVNTESERRNAVQSQVFTLLKNLVERKPGLQELLQGNNFSLLSRVVLSGCSSRNDIWRDGAMDVIVHLFRATPTMSKHKTRHQILVKALQERQFLANILDLTRRSKDVPYQLKTLKFVVELLASVSTFTPALEQDFVTENGYALLKKVILSLDGEYVPMHAGNLKVVKQGPTSESILRSIRRGSDPSNLGNSSIPDTNHHSSTLDEHAQEPDSGFKTTTVKNNGALTDSPRLLLRHLLTAISELSLVSDRTGPLKLSPPTDGYAQDPSFALPQPSREAKTVGNLAAYGVLMEAFGSSTHEWIKQELLKCIIIIITAEPANYFITRSTAPLTSIVREMNTMSTSARIDVYKLLSYLACSVNYVANQELQLLAELVAKTTDVSFMKLTVALVAKLVNFDERFTSVLKVVNILDAFCCLMRRYLPTSPPGGTTRDLYARTNDHARVHTSRNESNLMDYHSDNDTDLESGVSDTDITGIVVEKKGNGADMKKTLATVVVTDESYTFADNTKSASTRKPATKAEAIPVILEGLSLLVGKNEANLVIFQGHRLMPGLIELVKHIETRVPALHFCSRLIQTETFLAGAVFKSLMDLSVCGMRRSSPSKRRRRSARQLHADVVVALIILESVSHLLVCRASTRTLFRVNGGFAFIITQLADINGSGGIGSGKRYPVSLRASLSQLVGQCLSVLSASMAENDVLNSEYMRDRVGYEALRDVVSATGLLSEMDTNGAQLIYANLIAMALSSTTADEGTKLLTNVKAYSLSCATSLSPTQSQRHTRSSSLQNDNKKVDKIPPAVPPRHVLKSENNIARTDSWLKSTASSEDNVQAMRLDDNGSDHMSECRDIVNGGAVWTMLALVVQTPIDVQVRVLSLLVGWLHAEENQHMCAGFHVADLLLSLTHPEQQSGNTSAYSQQDIHEEPLQPILSKAENSCQTPNQLEMVSGDTPTSTNRDTIGQVHTAVRGQIPIQMEHSSVTSGKWVTDSSTLLGDGVSVTLWRNGVFFYLFELVAQRSCHPSLLRSVLVMYRNSIDVRPTDHRSFGKSTSVATLTPIDYSAQTSFIGRHSSVNPQLDTNVLVADTELEKEAWCTQILQLLLRMGNASSPVVPPSINFCMADNGYAGVVLPVTRTKSWPGNAYTFMTWIKIERWCDSPSGLADEHMVCLYTIVSPTETWLSATISRETGYLTIRCGQSQLQNKTIENTSDTSHGNHTNLVAEFNDHVFKTGVWYHVALVHSRSRLKSSVATLYVNGLKVQTERLSYVVGPPNNSASLNEVVCVVGTPYWKRQQSNLLWACGPVWVVCEALSAHAVCAAYFVGPRYTGTFRGKLRPYQTYEVISDRTLKAFDRSDLAIYNLNNAQSTMPSEDCTEFVLHVANSIPQSELSAKDTDRFMNGMTSVVKSMLLSLTGNLEKSSGGRCVAIRNAVDTRSPPSSQSILACGLMYGDTRVHDGVCLSDGVRMVSGVRVVLDIIETCKGIADLEGALRLLSCTVRHHAYLTGQMEALLGYQIVAMALKKRSRILSMGVVNILFELVGLSTDAATGTIGNISAFKNLLLDYEIWRLSDPAVSTAVFTNILTLITKTNQLWRFNIRRLRKLHITQRLLFQLRDETLPELAVKIIVQIIGRLLTIEGTDDDMERIARFVVTTVNPDQDISDRHVLMRHHLSQSYAHRPQAEGSGSAQLSCNLSVIQTSPIVGDGGQLSGGGRPFSPAKTASSKRDMKIMKSKEGPVVTPRKVIVRNFFLEELLSFLDNEGDKGLARVLHIFGVQWVMLFINENTDQKSLILALRLLVMFLIQAKDRNAVLAQFRKNYQGFLRLARGLEPHARCEQLYFSLFALLLGVNISDIPFGLSLDIAALYNFFSMTTKVTFAEPQTLVLLMELERSLQHTYLLETQTAEEDLPHPASEWEIPETEKDRIEIVAVTNILFVKHLYTSSRHPFYYSTSFITALIGVLFPKPLISVNKKRTSSTTSASLHSHVVKDGICTVQLLDNPVAGHVIELLVNIILDVEPIDVTHGGSQTSRGSTKDDSNVNRTPRRESVVLSDGLVKGTVNVIEHVLGAIPAVDEPLAIDFQTRLFTSIIEHVDAMSSEQLVRYLTVNEGNFAHLICVAIHMADTVVNGTFNGPNSRVWGFLVRILADMEHHTTLETVRLVQRLHRSLNVCIVSSLMNIDVTSSELESVLSDLLDIQNVVFQPTNNDLEFLETLTKILLEILENKRAVGRDVAFNLWKLMFLQKVEEMRSISTVLGPNHEVLDLYDVIFELLMSNAVEGLGEYLSSKHITRDGLTRNSSGGWLHYSRKVASVREYSNVQRKHSRAATMQLQIKKDAKIVDTMRNLRGQTLTTIESIHTYESTMYGKYRQHYLDSQNYTSIRAKHLFRDLWRERGLYGAEIETGAYWKLDVIEGPSRVRRRMCRNYDFVETYASLLTDGENALVQSGSPSQSIWPDTADGQSTLETITLKEQEVISELSELKVFSSDAIAHKLETDELQNEKKEDIVNINTSTGVSAPDQHTQSEDDVLVEDPADANTGDIDSIQSDGEEGEDVDFDDETDNMTIMRQLEPGDTIQFCFNCSRIQGLDTTDSVLLLCKRNIYIIDGYRYVYDHVTQKSNIMEVAMAMAELGDAYKPVVPKLADNFGGDGSTEVKYTKTEIGDDSGIIRCPYNEVHEVHKRRFLLREVALEIFSADGRDHLLAFDKCDRDTVYKKLVQSTVGSFSKTLSKGILDAAGATLALAGVKELAEESKGVFSQLWGERSPTQRWVAGELSNFQYLMWINTIAGRSYNDLTQYPVFPWVLADYTSDSLDLNDPKTFRDLTKPMGNQTPERATYYKQRYQNWEDPTGETPPFHYGTHFSSAMIVSSYLIRMEPYTQMFLTLQGGHFDHPDRMFHSIKEAWDSASKNNTADVKELIPEFYYLPEFLKNSNRFRLGKKQTGESLDDVTLPAWAKGDVHEFIRKHRQALESPYVSAHIHQWIDLVFGYKQVGEDAQKAMNVFHHLSYEGAVDIDQISDPVLRQAVIGIINNFGQTPRQVFKKPHPSRKLTTGATSMQASNQNMALIGGIGDLAQTLPRTVVIYPEQLRPTALVVKGLRSGSGVGDIALVEKGGVVAVGVQQLVVVKTTNRFLSWEFGDNSLRLMRMDNGKCIGACENMHVGRICAVTFADEQVLITGGEDGCVNVWQFADHRTIASSRVPLDVTQKLLQTLHGHTGPITAVAASRPYSVILSGSRDTTCMIWDLNQMDYIRQLRGHTEPITAIIINNQSGNIVTCSRAQVRLWTINGELLAKRNITRADLAITCCVLSESSEWESTGVIITGHENGSVCVWRISFIPNSTSHKHIHKSDGNCVDSKNESVPSVTDGVRVDSVAARHSSSSNYSNDALLVDVGYVGTKECVRRFVMVAALRNDTAQAVTCLRLSRDLKRLYVGDANGCITQWALPSSVGPFQSDWETLEEQEICSSCETPLSSELIVECQDCNGYFCGRCARFSAILPLKRIYQPTSVCRDCYTSQYGATVGVSQCE